MSYTLNATLVTYTECSIEITETELDIMVANGVDVTDEDAVCDFYRANLGKSFEHNGEKYYFAGEYDIEDKWHGKDKPEIEEFWVEGEAPDRFWPDEDDE